MHGGVKHNNTNMTFAFEKKKEFDIELCDTIGMKVKLFIEPSMRGLKIIEFGKDGSKISLS